MSAEGPDPDVGQMRAFVAVADGGHFGRAAARLSLSQQGLSARISALENRHGVLFVRGPAGAQLTDRGRELLPAARALLDAADRVGDVGGSRGSEVLRIDVWGTFVPPVSLTRAFAASHPDLVIEMGRRSDFRESLDALRRRVIDASYGWVGGLPHGLGHGLVSLPAALMDVSALVEAGGPLAQLDVLDRARLAQTPLVVHQQNTSPEIETFVKQFARDVSSSICDETYPVDIGTEVVRVGRGAATLIASSVPVPEGAAVVLRPIDPRPMYPWDLVCRADDDRPAVRRLLAHTRRRSPVVDELTDRVWLPPARRR